MQTRGDLLNRLSRADIAPTAVTGVALLLWSIYTYLTVRIDGDMVAEAIQVRQWLDSPFLVMSYPGQLYGGVLEYPLMALAEVIAPGDVYAFTLVRILYLPVVGLLMCVCVRWVNRDWSLWPLALAAVAGPALVHSIMAVKDLYPFSWLVATVGVTLVYREYAGRRRIPWAAAGAVLVGLGVYEHPTAALFAVPMVVAGVVQWSIRGRLALYTLLGFIVGLLPMVLQPAKETSYGTGMPTGPRLVEAFGLTGDEGSWAGGFVPNGWGVQFTDANALALPVGLQFVVNAALAALVGVALVVSVLVLVGHVRGRAPARYAYLATLWGAAAVCITVLSMVVRPIFYYGGSLTFLVWVTLAALPSVLPRRPRIVVTAAVLALMAVTSMGALLGTAPRFPAAVSFKWDQAKEVQSVATMIADAGVPYVYGSYWEALPVAFASGGRLHPLTNMNSRFPLPADHSERITVALLGGTTALPVGATRWPYSQDAVDIARALCSSVPDLTTRMPQGVVVLDCPADALTAFAADATPPSP